MNAEAIYAEHPTTLDPSIVAAVWSIRVGPTETGTLLSPYRVLPDGCLDLVLRVRPDDPESLAEPGVFVGGPATVAVLVAAAPGTAFLGVRFQPGRGGAALALSASHLTDLILAGADARAVLGPLYERLLGAGDIDALRGRLSPLLDILTERARTRSPPAHALHALALLQHSAGRAAVGEVARRIGVSERTLHRSVTEAAGLPPKTLANVLRFQHALALIRRGLPLTEVADRSGYSDQAHMTRSFRTLGGLTPGGVT